MDHQDSTSLATNTRDVNPKIDRRQAMRDTDRTHEIPLSHDLPCPHCGHAAHTFLPCSDSCACPPPVIPGTVRLAA